MELSFLSGFEEKAAIRYFSLGRHALSEGLKSLSIGRGHAVLMPEFICRDLIASVHAVQATPVFYPVDPMLSPRSLPEVADVKAVLMVNYFGFPQSMNPFRSYCKSYGAALIEDNAHGYLSRDADGTLLGSRGDVGLLSLRKTFALPDGAALLINREDWFDRMPAALPCRNSTLPRIFFVKRILRQIQNVTGLRVRSISETMTRRFRQMRTGHALPISQPESEVEIPGNPAIHCESLRMLKKINVIKEVARRRALYQNFHRDLHHLDIEPVFGELSPLVAPYGYPFRANVVNAASVARIAQRMGFDCVRWPDLPADISLTAPEFYRNVWWVNFLC